MNAPTSKTLSPFHARGNAALAFVPWLLGAGGLIFGFGMWLARPGDTPSGNVRPASDPADLQMVKLSLEAARGENQALRQELDRLLAVGRVRAQPPPAASSNPAAPRPAVPPPANDPQFQALTKRLGDELSRFGAGDRGALQMAAADIMGIVGRGHAALPALLDLYSEATSPEAKKILLAPLLFIGGAEGRDFVMSQAETETDPTLRKILLDQSAKYATPDVADRAQKTFLERLQSDEDSTTRLIAVRGLRYAQGADSQAALFRAAKDEDERVRLAAMDVLASRPGLRTQLREVATNDPSAHVREVAQCRLMVAENMP